MKEERGRKQGQIKKEKRKGSELEKAKKKTLRKALRWSVGVDRVF